ncbi:MAG: divalent-cation tolerance protein CutA [Candidatus Aenigmatarchaeota archaeon]
MAFNLLYVTCSSKAESKKIARHLLRKRLVACANIFPIESVYWWKGKIGSAKENVLVLKTSKKNAARAGKEIRKIHSYTVPCIIKFNVSANRDYEKWLKGEVHG